jgi:hypothetical protein
VLAGLASTGTCAGVQILESTLPDPGYEVKHWFADHGAHDDSFVSTEYANLMNQGALASLTQRSLIVLGRRQAVRVHR